MARSSGTGIVPIVLLIGGGYLVYKYRDKLMAMLPGSAHQLKEMRIKINGAHMENDGSLNMDWLVQNPNSNSFEFKSVLGILSVNNKPIAEVKYFGDSNVPGNNQATIPLSVPKVDRKVFADVVKMFKGKPIMMAFQGTVNVNDKTLPMTLQYKLQ
jgi:hypothetical protein